MRIEAVEVRCVTLPMAHPFVTAHGVERERPTVLVSVTTADGVGWGECVALPSPGYSPETAATSARRLIDDLAPRLLAGASMPAGTPMASAALEMAVLDLELRAAGLSLAERLGATADRVPSGITLGLDATVDDAVAAVEAGYRRVKLKVEPCPRRLVTVSSPPCSSTRLRVITRPSPVPPASRVARLFARKNRVKRF